MLDRGLRIFGIPNYRSALSIRVVLLNIFFINTQYALSDKISPFTDNLQGERQIHTDTLYTPAAAGGPYTPTDPLSPTDSFFPEKLFLPDLGESKPDFEEQFLDIGSLPVVLEESLTHHTPYTHYTQYRQPFIEQEDSLDRKLVAVAPLALESAEGAASTARPTLTLSMSPAAGWTGELVSTPDVVSFVDQLQGTQSLGDLVSQYTLSH